MKFFKKRMETGGEREKMTGDALAEKMAGTVLRCQRKWADALQRKTDGMSRTAKLTVLIIIVALMCVVSTCFIAGGIKSFFAIGERSAVGPAK